MLRANFNNSSHTPGHATGHTPGTIADPDYQISQLDNGLTVATFPMPWRHEVGATLIVRAGTRYEPDTQAGVAHFLEHMLFKGTRRFPKPTQLHTHLESMAADMNAATGQETNGYWITLPPDFLEEGLATFCEMFTQPAFAGIETERRVILSEMREDENEAGENTNPMILGGQKLWPGHPLARPVLGFRAAINEISVQSLRGHLSTHYHGPNMALAFCGPVHHQRCLELANSGLGSLPSGQHSQSDPPAPMPPGPHWVAVDDQTAQFTLTLFFRTSGFQDPAFHAVAALRRILDDGFSSRLQSTIREQQGLVYDVWAAFTSHSDTGVLELGASSAPDNLEAVFLALLQQLPALRSHPPQPAEWQRLLTRWRAGLTTSLDHPSELIERYVADRLYNAMEPLGTTWQRVQAIAPHHHLPKIAAQLFQPENLVVTLVGPNAHKTLPQLRSLFEGEL